KISCKIGDDPRCGVSLYLNNRCALRAGIEENLSVWLVVTPVVYVALWSNRQLSRVDDGTIAHAVLHYAVHRHADPHRDMRAVDDLTVVSPAGVSLHRAVRRHDGLTARSRTSRIWNIRHP